MISHAGEPKMTPVTGKARDKTMRDGLYRLDLAAQDGMDHGAMRVSDGRFFGAASRYVLQGRLQAAEDGGLTGAMIVRKTKDQATPVLGQFKEATLAIRGSYDPVARTFSWDGQAYGHHSIVIQGRGHELPGRLEAAPHVPTFKPGSLILMRHASVDRSPGVLVGTDDALLNDTGLAQAMAWQSVFTARPPAAIFAGPLRRAVQTARLAVTDQSDSVLVREALREIHLGTWEGLDREKIERRFPGAWEERGRNFAGFRPEGGESFQDVLDRALPVFREMAARAEAESGPVLAVTHAGVIRVLLCHVLGMPLNNLFRLHQDWAGLSILEPAADRWRVRCLNARPAVFSNCNID
jgi:broad specificity phosphatase PhoE